jgi:hypothetical protein
MLKKPNHSAQFRSLHETLKLKPVVKRGNTTDALFVIPQLDRSKLVFKKVICGEYPVEAIIDTGSGITVVSPNFSKMLGIPLQPWVGPDILLADGQRTRPSGSVEIKVTIDNIVVEVSAIVLQINGYDLLLGNDTLRKLISIKINYTAEQASFHLGDIDYSDNKPAGHSNFIVAKEAQTIPAHSMMAIAVRRTNVAASTNVGLLMVEPSSKVMLDKGLSVGRFCYQSDSPPDVVRLINFSDSPQWIGEGSKLGEIVDVEIANISPLPAEDPITDFDFENSINTELLIEHRQAIKDFGTDKF